MIFVPRVGSQNPGGGGFAAPRVLPVQNQAGRQIAQVGGALAQVGGAAWRAGDLEQEQLDVALLRERDNMAADTIHQALRDPQNGFLSKRGKNAIEGRSGVLQDIEDKLSKLNNGLDDAQAQQFAQVRNARLQSAVQLIDSHTSREVAAFEMGQTQASLERRAGVDWLSAVDEATRYGQEGDAESAGRTLMVAHAMILNDVDDLAEQRGLSDEERNALRQEHLTRAHAAALSGMAGQDPVKASSYLRKYGDEMDPVIRAKAQQVVDGEIQRARVDLMARKLLATKKTTLEYLGDIDAMGLDGDTRNKLRAQVIQESEKSRQLHEQQGADYLEQLKEKVSATGQEPTPEEFMMLETYGKQHVFSNWRRREGNPITSSFGDRLLADIELNPRAAFAPYPTLEDFVNAYETELSKSDMKAAYIAYRKMDGIATLDEITDGEKVKLAKSLVMSMPDWPVGDKEAQAAFTAKWEADLAVVTHGVTDFKEWREIANAHAREKMWVGGKPVSYAMVTAEQIESGEGRVQDPVTGDMLEVRFALRRYRDMAKARLRKQYDEEVAKGLNSSRASYDSPERVMGEVMNVIREMNQVEESEQQAMVVARKAFHAAVNDIAAKNPSLSVQAIHKLAAERIASNPRFKVGGLADLDFLPEVLNAVAAPDPIPTRGEDLLRQTTGQPYSTVGGGR